MPNLTLVITDELKREMDKHHAIKWSSAVRAIIEQKLADFEEMEGLAKKSKFTMKHWKLIEGKVSKGMAKHARALLDENNR